MNRSSYFVASALAMAAVPSCAADGTADAPYEVPRLDAVATPTIPWPGPSDFVSVDVGGSFPQNLSALAYEPARASGEPVLWALQNGPAVLFQLQASSIPMRPSAAFGARGKALRFPDGRATPDAEGIALLPDPQGARYVYAVTERANESLTSRLSVLRFDTRTTSPTLTASHEWNLTRDLPKVGGNTGLEALAYVPDGDLAPELLDERGQRYDPVTEGEHAGGVFFVGMEQTGMVYGYVLDHGTGAGFRRVAAIDTGLAGVMALEYDFDRRLLWAYCDDTCGNRAVLLTLERRPEASLRGKVVPTVRVEPPATLSNLNHEGIAIAPDSECREGAKSFFWVADGASDGHAIRRGRVRCGRDLAAGRAGEVKFVFTTTDIDLSIE
jgi:hypothetical protein